LSVGGFSPAGGGVVCRDCAGAAGFGLSEAARSFMTAALAGPLRDAPVAHAATLLQVDRAVTETLEHHAHVRLRSVA
jgi:DNA repair protein RecO (recombination protein O)